MSMDWPAHNFFQLYSPSSLSSLKVLFLNLAWPLKHCFLIHFLQSSDCVVTVTIELGHQANFLKEPSPEGFTHDWTVFVRGYEGSRIEYFVEKVVFKLHKTFKSPVRGKIVWLSLLDCNVFVVVINIFLLLHEGGLDSFVSSEIFLIKVDISS